MRFILRKTYLTNTVATAKIAGTNHVFGYRCRIIGGTANFLVNDFNVNFIQHVCIWTCFKVKGITTRKDTKS